MSIFSQSTLDKAAEIEANGGKAAREHFAIDTYKTSIMSMEVVEQEAKEWKDGQAVPTGEMEDVVIVDIAMESTIEGGEVKTWPKGEEAQFNSYRLYLNPLKMGIGPQGASIARRFVAACLGKDNDEKITIKDFEEVVTSEKFKGMPLKVVFGEKSNGKKIVGTKPTDIRPATWTEETPKG